MFIKTKNERSSFGKLVKSLKTETLAIIFVVAYLMICLIFYYKNSQNREVAQLVAEKQIKVALGFEKVIAKNSSHNQIDPRMFKYIGNGRRKDPSLQLVGFMTINETDDSNINLDNANSYIESGLWKLKSNDKSYAIYYLKNNDAYVHYLKTKNLPLHFIRYSPDPPEPDSAFFKSIWSKLLSTNQDKVVPFRYNIVSNQLRIPVNNDHLLAWRIFFFAALGILVALSLYAAWNLITFLTSLFSGDSFSSKNIKRLTYIAYYLLLFPIIPILFGLLQPILFKSYFTDDLVFNYGFLFRRYKFYIACLIFLLLLKAFKKGKALQEEQDLTV